MKSLNRIWQLGVVGLVALGLARVPLARATVSTVAFDYNGIGWTSQTTARDVSEALIETLGDYSNLVIHPEPWTPLTSYTHITITDGTSQVLDSAVSKNFRVTVAAQKEEEARVEEAKRETEKPRPRPTPTPAPTPTPKPAPAPVAAEIHSGLATWYRHGDGLTTASRDFPKGTKLRVIAVNSGKSVDVVVNDYGPSAATGIALDLNLPAFEALAPAGAGKIQIKYYKL